MTEKTTDYQWLFLDLNSYFASVEQQLQPALRGKPVAVVPLMTDSTCAIAASYEAKAFGIRTGTKIFEAKRLCPQLILVEARHDAYVDFHHRILEEIDRHLPIETIESVDEVSCRLLGPQCTRQSAIALAQQIKAGLRANIGEYVRCSIGIAPNKYLAKVATDLQKPDGLVVLEAADLPGPLLHLALTDLPGIARGMSARLNRGGIYRMADLWRVNPKTLRHIWGGIEGERFWYKLHGIQLPERPTTRRTVGHSHVLAPEWRPEPQARIVAERLLLKAASRLRRLGFYAQAMTLSVRVENGPRLAVDTRFHRTCDSPGLHTVLLQLWEEVTHSPARRERPQAERLRIKKVAVTLHGLIAQDEVQPELFDHPQAHQRQKRREQLSRAMDTLNAKYGRDTVVMGFLPKRSHAFSGTKIAFTRIPDTAEFHE